MERKVNKIHVHPSRFPCHEFEVFSLSPFRMLTGGRGSAKRSWVDKISLCFWWNICCRWVTKCLQQTLWSFVRFWIQTTNQEGWLWLYAWELRSLERSSPFWCWLCGTQDTLWCGSVTLCMEAPSKPHHVWRPEDLMPSWWAQQS